MKIGKRDVESILPALDPKWKELDEAAKDEIYAVGERILEAAWARYAQRGRFYVAVQILTYNGQQVKRTDPRGGSVLLGPYITVTQAEQAARSARIILGGKYTCLAAVLDAQETTPGAWAKAWDEANTEDEHTDERWRELIAEHEIDRLINPEVCGEAYLDEELNILGFCNLPHRHGGACEARIDLDIPQSARTYITGLTQTVREPEDDESSTDVLFEDEEERDGV